MIAGTMNISRSHTDTWDRHLSPGTLGHLSAGRTIAAGLCGLACDFMNETMTDEIDTVAGTQIMRKLIPASGAGSLATPLKYFMHAQSLVVKAGSTGAGAVAATTGIIPYSALQPRARGIFNIALADVDAAAVLAITSHGLNWLAMNTRQSWEVTFNLVYIINPDILAANGACEIGVGSTDTDDDPANPLATRFCAFRISDNRIYLSDESTATIAQTSIPDGPTSLTLKYDAGAHAIVAYVNGQFLGQSPCNAAFVSAGIAIRAYHTAAYTALGAAPLGVGIDSIVAVNPTLFG